MASSYSRAWLTLFVLSLAVGSWMLFTPTPDSPALFPNADKIVHGLMFGVFAATGLLARISRRYLVPGLAAYAVASELVQRQLLPTRAGDLRDVVADLVGIALAVAAVGWVQARAGAGSNRIRG